MSSPKTCAVIVAAYQAERWIEEMVASFHGQLPYPGWRYHLAIGVDGCTATYQRLREAGHSFWWSGENRGSYLIRNSLIEATPADAYSIFDADDFMFPSFLSSLLPVVERGLIAGPGRAEQRGSLPNVWKHYRFAGGIVTFSRQVWETVGSFRPDRLSSDTDFLHRAAALGIEREGVDEKPLYFRRLHANNITRQEGTRLGGPRRRRIREEHKRLREEGHLHVPPAIVPIEWVTGGDL